MSDNNKIGELREKILGYVKENGPLLPTDVSKHMKGNLLFASAILSELVSNKILKMSNAKIGGSKLYFYPGQEPGLVKVHDHLSEKPRKAFDLLIESKVLRDEYCEPWERVALRELKDFAMPVVIKTDNEEKLFWKWFTVPDEEAKEIIQEALKKKEPEPEPAPVPAAKEPEPIKVEPVKEEAKETLKKKPKKIIEKQQVLSATTTLHSEDDFTSSVLGFLNNSNIFIIDQKLLKRNKEINFVIEFGSIIGKSCYYVKAKNKKKISDKDLIDAHDEAKEENLPLLFVSNGELTKKAANFIAQDLKGIVFKQL